jgi:Cys-rich protein (TIGR01571 family)
MADSFQEPIFGCFRDLFSCLIAFCCPGGYCYIQASARTKATHEECLVPYMLPLLLLCVGAGINRRKLREHHGISGNIASDCLIHAFCGLCAVTQEYREASKEGPD